MSTTAEPATTCSVPDASTVWRPTVRVSLALALGPFQRGTGDPTQRRAADGATWRTVRSPLGPATVRLAVRSNGDVEAEAWGPGADWVVSGVPALLGGLDDVAGFAPAHEVVAASWRARPHLRLPRLGVVTELLVVAVLEQRVTGQEARRSWRELLWRFGEPAPGPTPWPMRVAPTPWQWRHIPSWEWHRAGVDPARSRTIVTACRYADRLEASLGLDREVRLARLRALPGVGEWTVAEVAQRAWGEPDLPSVGDFHLHDLVGWALAGRPASDEQMLELLGAYPGHRHRAARLVELSGARKPRFAPRLAVGDIRGW